MPAGGLVSATGDNTTSTSKCHCELGTITASKESFFQSCECGRVRVRVRRRGPEGQCRFGATPPNDDTAKRNAWSRESVGTRESYVDGLPSNHRASLKNRSNPYFRTTHPPLSRSRNSMALWAAVSPTAGGGVAPSQKQW